MNQSIGGDSEVLVDYPTEGVCRILINRPDKRNAIDFEVREQMYQALLLAKENASVRAVVLGGVDNVFSAGGDLDSMGGLDQEGAQQRMKHIHRLCILLGNYPLPVVSAVEGFCAGAAVGMSLLGDFIVAGSNSKIIFPFMGLGLVPDWGAMLTLPRRIGVGRARQIMTEGRVISGEDAFNIGVVDVYVGEDNVMEAAIEKAISMTLLPQSAFIKLKDRLNCPSTSLTQELQREENDQVALLQGPEFNEGYTAVMNKKKPDFSAITRDESEI